ncbi:MAG: putative caspase-like protein [Myxococcota bacterium]|jgi:uncharacterized caspase-like protein
MIPLFALLNLASAGVTDAPTADLDAVYAPRRVALLLGVQEYEDPQLQGLRYAAKDARDLGSVLSDPALGGFDQVYVVEGRYRTTAEAIRQAISEATADLQRDDTFLLYISGHGTLTIDPLGGSNLYLLPSDGDLDTPETTGVPVAWLEEVVNALPARRRVLILDTCHNGRARSALSANTSSTLQTLRGEAPAPRDILEISESEARLYAAEYHQPAMEDPNLENGVYTHFLISALTDARRSADLDADGLVDVVEAHDFAMDATIRHTGGAQMPRAEYRITGHEKIYLSGDPTERSTAEHALLSAYNQILRTAHLFVDGVPRGPVVGVHAVEPGSHQIELQSSDGRTLVSERVRVAAGTTTPLEDLLRQDTPRWMFSTGATVRTGAGQDYFHPIAAELELTRLEPFSAPSWMRPEVHVRLSGMTGAVNGEPAETITAGELAAGIGIGVAITPALSVGPVFEAMMPWRTYTYLGNAYRQTGYTGATGLRALYLKPIGDAEISLRYDSRVSPVQYDGSWTNLWHHGVAIGLSRR